MAVYSDKKTVPSLEDACVRHICKNLSSVTYLDQQNSEPRRFWKFSFRSFRILARPAQKLLSQMCKRKILNDECMYLFSKDYVDLISPSLREARIGPVSLRVLKDFNLLNLSAVNMDNLNLNNIIGCLSEQSLRNIICLNISGTSIMSESRVPIVVSIGWFKSLNILNVSRTEVTTSSLQIIVKDLSHLTFLDISRTKVEDISVLLDIKDRLKSLVMHRIETSSFENVLSVIVQLHKLRYLDASDKAKVPFVRMPKVDLLIAPETLPDLIKIDLSGNPFGLNIADAKELVRNHPHLEFCGFTSWNGNSEKELEELYKFSLSYPKITLLGDRGDQLLLNTLTHCRDRASYLQNAFQSIFEATNNLEVHKPELLAAVLAVMRIHVRRMELMLAGTAVVYNLTKSELCNRYPAELLNRAVRVTLSAMEKFPNNRQLYKNCFLTLCSDHVLHETKFSCKTCCELVFNGLLQFDDTHMNRMGVAIISILAAEIATSDLRDLAKDPNRIKCLLTYVAEKCLLQTDIRVTSHDDEMDDPEADPEPILSPPASAVPQYFNRLQVRRTGPPIFDATLRFTLSALWNLTDECAEACQGFVSNGGLFIYEKVLFRFRDQENEKKDHVYTKCLGLLNNVAEVESTGHNLMKDNLMNFFLKMLRHPSIQISYFAAGIIAHLSCLPEQTWINKLDGFVTKESCIRQLGQAVCSWSQPNSEMVAYRSFKPFETLIFHHDSRLEIQLWAVWAINHITTRKQLRYVPVLRECQRLYRYLERIRDTSELALCMCTHHEMQVGRGATSYKAWDDSLTTYEVPIGTSSPNKMKASDWPDSPLFMDCDTTTLGRSEALLDQKGMEHVNGVSLGVVASPGPREDQLLCARLIRKLAEEILICDARIAEESRPRSLEHQQHAHDDSMFDDTILT